MLTLLLFQQLILSEIMYNPKGSEHHNEFIEIFNKGIDSISIEGWHITDGTGTDILIYFSGPLMIPPKSYALILDGSYHSNSNLYDDIIPKNISIYTTNDKSIGSGGLSNSTSETVTLLSKSNHIIDSFTYPLGAEDGHSIERRIHYNNEWWFSEKPLGTPGKKNSQDHFIELLLSNVFYNLSQELFFVSVKNQEPKKRNGVIWLEIQPKRFEGTFFEKTSLVQKKWNFSLSPKDSLNVTFPFSVPFESQYRLIYTLKTDSSILLSDSLNFIFLRKQFPLWISYIKLTNPQQIELKNQTSFSIELKFLKLQGSGGWKNISIPLSIFPKQSIRISKHSSQGVDYFDENIPFLYTKNGTLKIQLLEHKDSLTYSIDSLFFSENGHQSIIPEYFQPYNYQSHWIINPNKNQNDATSPEVFHLEITPNPFSPDGDGKNDLLFIKLSHKEFHTVQLDIYSIYGKHLKEITPETYFSLGNWSWDGTLKNGKKATSGVYLLLFRAKQKKDGIYLIKKYPLVLYRK